MKKPLMILALLLLFANIALALTNAEWNVIFEEARNGDAVAQYKTGLHYGSDKRDYEEAYKWFSKAADQGYAAAQFILSEMYYDGIGVPRDYVLSFKWCAKAAEQNHPQAVRHMALNYYEGVGVEQNYEKAFEYYLMAAKLGVFEARRAVGSMYYLGDGTPQDFDKALEWLREPAEQGDGFAQYRMGDVYSYGFKNYSEAAKWYSKAVETAHNDPKALDQYGANCQFRLGDFYYFGYGVEQNDNEAAEWYAKAAANGHPLAQEALQRLRQQQ